MKTARLYSLLLLLLSASALAVDKATPARDISGLVSAEVAKGNVIPRVTTAEDFKAMFGSPAKEDSSPDGGGSLITLSYADDTFAVFKQMTTDGPAALVHLGIKGSPVQFGKPLLRDVSDLKKLDRFLGLAEVSLANLDLRASGDLLRQLPFDSLTEWPPQDRLPVDFDPAVVLEKGMNPGLGIRQLHKAGIDGRGVGIAIIDQPLLLGHREYSSRLAYYNATVLSNARVDMHGPSVASLAVGKDIGTAPKAILYYIAVPSWIPDNSYPANALLTIVELNKTVPENAKIRIVSISHGGFRQRKNFDQWQEALHQANVNNILVISCDPASVDFGNLTRAWGKDPDFPESYEPEAWDKGRHPLWVPGGNRTRASYKGNDVYAFDVTQGGSWAAPYLAGVAALGYQINRGLSPAAVKEMLVKSATLTKNGPILNPRGFVELVKKTAKKE